MSTFILVHGAWHGGWCWRHIAPLLRARGHEVHAPDLPGHGDDPAPASAQTLDSYAAADRRPCLDSCSGEVVLVGHSLGGLVISAVAEAQPERLRRLVYVTAFLPRDGDSLVRICSVDPDNPLNAASVRTPDGKCVTVDPERAAGNLLRGLPGGGPRLREGETRPGAAGGHVPDGPRHAGALRPRAPRLYPLLTGRRAAVVRAGADGGRLALRRPC